MKISPPVGGEIFCCLRCFVVLKCNIMASRNFTLEQLFDSPAKIQLIKLFVRNNEKIFTLKEAAAFLRLSKKDCGAALKELAEIGFLKSKTKITAKGPAGKSAASHGVKKKKSRVVGYFADQNFVLFSELKNAIHKTMPLRMDRFAEKIKKTGRIKLLALAGVFLNNDKKRVDLFVVGDKIKQGRLKKIISDIESRIGQEILFSAMDTAEFKYRHKMFDRFVRDILEYPHEKLIYKIK